MTITFKSIFAWVLIFIGLGLIFWDISTTYNYFTGRLEFPQIFAEPKIDTTQSTSGQGGMEQITTSVLKGIMGDLMPANSVSELLNLSSWILFATFLIYAGGKLVGMGNDFLKS